MSHRVSSATFRRGYEAAFKRRAARCCSTVPAAVGHRSPALLLHENIQGGLSTGVRTGLAPQCCKDTIAP
eukprot:354763-Chlamydomonas_euryale.AAC.2